MKTTKFSESQIVGILKLAETGVPVTEICRSNGVSSATFYKWRAKYGGMDVSMLSKVRELEAENNRLKRMYAELQIDHSILKEAMTKKW